MSFTKEEVRTIIKFSFLLGKSASAMHEELAQDLGEEAASGLSTVKRWSTKFREGNTEITDGTRSGRPTTATTDDNVRIMQELLAEAWRLAVQEISLEVGISKEVLWTFSTTNSTSGRSAHVVSLISSLTSRRPPAF